MHESGLITRGTGIAAGGAVVVKAVGGDATPTEDVKAPPLAPSGDEILPDSAPSSTPFPELVIGETEGPSPALEDGRERGGGGVLETGVK